jgi:hypothetical protein
MTDLAATDVTVTVLKQRIGEHGYRAHRCKLEFGDGALTYPANGIPITKADFGMPNEIQSMIFYDQGTSGYKFSYDQSAEKIIVHQAPAQSHNHTLFLNDGDVSPDAAASRVNAAGDKLGINSGSDVTVAGVANQSGSGGILTETLAAAALAEASTVAIAAQILECEVIGW